MSDFDIVKASPAQVRDGARIIYEAFKEQYGAVQVASFPNPEAVEIILFSGYVHDDCCEVITAVDRSSKQVIGINILWTYDGVAAIGPVAVDMKIQAKGIGRRMMDHAIQVAKERFHCTSIRLQHLTSVARSFGLYAAIGFKVQEMVHVLEGWLLEDSSDHGLTFRVMTEEDFVAIDEAHKAALGHSRLNELRISMALMKAGVPARTCMIALDREDKLVAFTSGFISMGFSLARSPAALRALYVAWCKHIKPLVPTASATTATTPAAAAATASTEALPSTESKEPPQLLQPQPLSAAFVPSVSVCSMRQPGLLQGLLKCGLRVAKQWNLMAMGEYQHPAKIAADGQQEWVYGPNALY